jgi:hypothetical protein
MGIDPLVRDHRLLSRNVVTWGPAEVITAGQFEPADPSGRSTLNSFPCRSELGYVRRPDRHRLQCHQRLHSVCRVTPVSLGRVVAAARWGGEGCDVGASGVPGNANVASTLIGYPCRPARPPRRSWRPDPGRSGRSAEPSDAKTVDGSSSASEPRRCTSSKPTATTRKWKTMATSVEGF